MQTRLMSILESIANVERMKPACAAGFGPKKLAVLR